MRTAFGVEDVVAVRHDLLFKGVDKLNDDVHFNIFRFSADHNGLMHAFFTGIQFLHVRQKAIRFVIDHSLFLTVAIIVPGDLQARIQICGLMQAELDGIGLKAGIFKDLRIRLKCDGRTVRFGLSDDR